MNTRLVSLRVREDLLERSEKIAAAESRSRAQILTRWMEAGSALGIDYFPVPRVPSDAFVYRDKVLDGIVAASGVELPGLEIKALARSESESQNLTAAGAMASVRPEVRAAKVLAKIQKKSSGAARGRVFYGHPEAMTSRSILGDEEDDALVGAAGSPVEAPSCSECFKYLTTIKGKLVCATPGCTLEGLVQM